MTTMKTFLCSLTVSSILAAPAYSIELISPVDPSRTIQTSTQAELDFEQEISLELRRDVSLLPSEQVIQMVESADFRDGNDVTIQPKNLDIDPTHNVVIGYSGGTAAITDISKAPNGEITLVASFKRDGEFIAPPIEQIGVMNAYGDPLCFDYEDYAVAGPPMRFTILLDRSGSMEDYMRDVIKAAYGFIDALPETPYCALGSYSDELIWHHEQPAPHCQRKNFRIGNIQGFGKTETFASMMQVYKEMQTNPANNKAVILITDGGICDLPGLAYLRKQALLAEKQDTRTFVYWLGDVEEGNLKELADGYLSNKGGIRQSLKQYFGTLLKAYTTQRVMTVKACPDNGGQP